MLKNATSATTRNTSALLTLARRTGHLLVPQQVVTSPESRLSYRVERLLGEGGFGQAFLAARVGRSTAVPSTVCVKVSPHIDGWLREAYFGDLLDDHPRAIRIFDRFPYLRPDGQVLYCLAMEYARHGDLSAHLLREGKAFSETVVRREIAGILQVLDKLHQGRMLHRDLTPLNVFVCEGRKLKLGDFGIARQQSDRRGITVRTLNPFTAPSDILAGQVPKWQARDDVYQVGQLLGILVKGDARTRINTGEIRHLVCSDHLKEIIHRCIGERRKRYDSAEELIDALQHPPARSQPACCDPWPACTWRSQAPSAARARRPPGPRHAPGRSSTASRRRRPRWWSAAGPTRSRPPGGTPG